MKITTIKFYQFEIKTFENFPSRTGKKKLEKCVNKCINLHFFLIMYKFLQLFFVGVEIILLVFDIG